MELLGYEKKGNEKMIKQYEQIIRHKIEMDENVLDNFYVKHKDEFWDVDGLFEGFFFYIDFEIRIDGNVYSIEEVERYYSIDIYNTVYNMIYDWFTKKFDEDEENKNV